MEKYETHTECMNHTYFICFPYLFHTYFILFRTFFGLPKDPPSLSFFNINLEKCDPGRFLRTRLDVPEPTFSEHRCCCFSVFLLQFGSFGLPCGILLAPYWSPAPNDPRKTQNCLFVSILLDFGLF